MRVTKVSLMVFLVFLINCNIGDGKPKDENKEKPSVIRVIINNIAKAGSQTESSTCSKQKNTSVQKKVSSFLEKILTVTAVPVCLACILYKIFRDRNIKIEKEISILKKALRIFSFSKKKK
ncbi:hypothetical protein ACFLYU_00870 [Candidatus Dependentiae bacterium]